MGTTQCKQRNLDANGMTRLHDMFTFAVISALLWINFRFAMITGWFYTDLTGFPSGINGFHIRVLQKTLTIPKYTAWFDQLF